MIKIISDADFSAEVLESPVPVLVDFFATWCGPCGAMAPVLEDLSAQYEGKAVFAKIDVDENPAAARKYRVMSIPYMALFKGGEVVDKIIGAVPAEQVAAMIDKAL